MSFKMKIALTACSLLLAGQVVHADDPYAGAMDHKDLVQDAKKQVSDSNGNGDEQPTPKKTSPDDYGSSDSSDSDDSDSADDTESDGS